MAMMQQASMQQAREYQIEELNIELSRTADKDSGKFLDEIRMAWVYEDIMKSYEITVKSNIRSYIGSKSADLSNEDGE